MQSIKQLITLISALLINFCTNAQAIDTTNIFMVCAKDNNNSKGPTVTQTGFICTKYNGLITSLHGVAGKPIIYAVNERGDNLPNLRIEKADVENDIALLVSDKVNINSAKGIRVISLASISTGQKLQVFGHPVGMRLNNKTVSVGRPVVENFESVIPSKLSIVFSNRKSPAPSTSIIYLEGNLTHGQSGAPVISGSSVVGVACGGILGGAAGISWAIPLDNLKLADATAAPVANKINSLQQYRVEELFDNEIIENNADDDELLTYNFSPINIPYAIGEYDNDTHLYKIKFSEKRACTIMSNSVYKCSMQPLCNLPPGSYVCEFAYRIEATGTIKKQEDDPNSFSALDLSVYSMKGNDAPGKSLIKKYIYYDKSDYTDGKFKTSRLNFSITDDTKKVSCAAFSYEDNMTVYIKSIKIYSKK